LHPSGNETDNEQSETKRAEIQKSGDAQEDEAIVPVLAAGEEEDEYDDFGNKVSRKFT
jgi:hypothetical protein